MHKMKHTLLLFGNCLMIVFFGVHVRSYQKDHNKICPHFSQFKFRERGFCNGPNKAYMCIEDVNNDSFIELCEKHHDIQRPGFKVVHRGNLDSETCGKDHYQPFTFYTIYGSDCVLKKSKCNGEGQVEAIGGSVKNDSSCRCDHTRGFAFVNKPADSCYCVPSKEDCSCFKKGCSFHQELMADYTCRNKDESAEDCKDFQTVSSVSSNRNLGFETIQDHYFKPSSQDIDGCRYYLLPVSFFMTVAVIFGIEVILVMLYVERGVISIKFCKYLLQISIEKYKDNTNDDGRRLSFPKSDPLNNDFKLIIKSKLKKTDSQKTERKTESFLKVAVVVGSEVDKEKFIGDYQVLDSIMHAKSPIGDLYIVDVPVPTKSEISKTDKSKDGATDLYLQAILFVLNCGSFTTEDFKIFQRCLECFGNAMKEHVMIAFMSNDKSEVNNCLEKNEYLKMLLEIHEIKHCLWPRDHGGFQKQEAVIEVIKTLKPVKPKFDIESDGDIPHNRPICNGS